MNTQTRDLIIKKVKDQWLKDFGDTKISEEWDFYFFVGFLSNVLSQIDFSETCKCGEDRTGETWCCNQCGFPVPKT